MIANLEFKIQSKDQTNESNNSAYAVTSDDGKQKPRPIPKPEAAQYSGRPKNQQNPGPKKNHRSIYPKATAVAKMKVKLKPG